MRIEPCLYCGDSLKELVSGDAQCLGCGVVVEYCNIPLYNRLSRIVRAAEEYVKAREAIPGEVFAEFGDDSVSFPAYEELKDAVEGGNANAEGD
jgi:hypothetical protein